MSWESKKKLMESIYSIHIIQESVARDIWYNSSSTETNTSDADEAGIPNMRSLLYF